MRKLLLTGASGFLGTILHQELSDQFHITTLGRSSTNRMVVDITREIPLFNQDFDLVIHAAGKAHVIPRTTKEKQLFYATNHTGTLNLLRGLENCHSPPRKFVFISTVAVYGKEEGENISEEWPVAGKSPYAESKIQAERAVSNWCELRQVNWFIFRLPLIVGPRAPGNLRAISQAIQKGFYISIKKNEARKSAVLANDVARLIPTLNDHKGIYNLTDGIHPTFNQIEMAIARALGKKISYTLPRGAVALMAKLGDLAGIMGFPAPLNTAKLQKMTRPLTFNDKKARKELNWQSNSVLTGEF